eukprot:603341-Pyramimonas_sp.AAC.1
MRVSIFEQEPLADSTKRVQLKSWNGLRSSQHNFLADHHLAHRPKPKPVSYTHLTLPTILLV